MVDGEAGQSEQAEAEEFATATAEFLRQYLRESGADFTTVETIGSFPGTAIVVRSGHDGFRFELFTDEDGSPMGASLGEIQRRYRAFETPQRIAGMLAMDYAEGWTPGEFEGPDDDGIWWIRR